MTGWSSRFLRPTGPQELRNLRDAARDLADQTRHSKAKVVFHTVADCAIIGTAVVGGVLASIHLWKALFPKPREEHREHLAEAAGKGREPPRRRMHVTTGEDPDNDKSR